MSLPPLLTACRPARRCFSAIPAPTATAKTQGFRRGLQLCVHSLGRAPAETEVVDCHGVKFPEWVNILNEAAPDVVYCRVETVNRLRLSSVGNPMSRYSEPRTNSFRTSLYYTFCNVNHPIINKHLPKVFIRLANNISSRDCCGGVECQSITLLSVVRYIRGRSDLDCNADGLSQPTRTSMNKCSILRLRPFFLFSIACPIIIRCCTLSCYIIHCESFLDLLFTDGSNQGVSTTAILAGIACYCTYCRIYVTAHGQMTRTYI